MESKIFLDPTSPTDISAYRGKVISYLRLQLAGKGKISSCVLNFFNKDGDSDNAAWLKLIRPGFATSPVLVPDGDACFLVMEYDYCSITEINGETVQGDRFLVMLKELIC